MLRRDFNKAEYCRKSCFISSVSCQRNTTVKQRKAKKNSLPANLYFQPSLMAVSSGGAEPTSCSTADISLPEAPHHVRTPDSSTRKPHVCLQPCTAPASCCRGTSYPRRRQTAPSCTPGHLRALRHPGNVVTPSKIQGAALHPGATPSPAWWLFHSPEKSHLAFVSLVAHLMPEKSRKGWRISYAGRISVPVLGSA